MLLCRHLAGDEDAEMANALVQTIDNRLAGCDDLVLVVVEVEDPVQSLLGGRDVVAPRAEHDDRRFDVAQVDTQAIGAAQLAGGQLVADEELVGDRLHLLGIQQHGAAPPFLEFEETGRFRVYFRIEIIDFFPIGVVGMQRFEVRDQIGAVEDAVADIARQGG